MRDKTVYLYAGGWAAVLFEKEDRDAGTVRFVDLVEKWGPRFDGPGRLILRDGLIDLVKRAHAVKASPARSESGSEATRRLGICVGYLSVTARKGGEVATFFSFPDLLSGEWVYQERVTEPFPAEGENPLFWSDYRIRRILRAKSVNGAGTKGKGGE